MGLTLFLLVFVLLFFVLGMPLAFSMIATSVLYALCNEVHLGFLALEFFGSLDTFVLLAVPLFILTSEVMNESTIGDRIFGFANSLVGHIPGGLGHVNLLTSLIFSGMSGAAVADVGGVGRLCLNAMTKEGFDEEFSAAVTGASAVIGPIIPPSVPMIIFAMVTDVSIGKLFLGGIIPGFIMALSLMIYIYFVSKKRNYPVGQRLNLRKLRQALGRGFLPLLTPVILLGSIYGGFCTVTEAAALAVLYSSLLGAFVYRRLGFQSLFSVLRKVFISIGPILIIFSAAKIFGYVLTTEKVPDLFAQVVLQFAAHPFMVILLINALFLILGCFSDPNVNIILFVPIVFPLVQMTKMDPIHFGVMVVLNAMIGLNTPPMGQLLITLKGFVDISYEQIIKAMWPFILILLLDLLIIILIPATTTYLPNLFFK